MLRRGKPISRPHLVAKQQFNRLPKKRNSQNPWNPLTYYETHLYGQI